MLYLAWTKQDGSSRTFHVKEEHNMSSTPAENKMGVLPIPRLLITMSLPMMVSMLVQALYNIVDSIFVAMISEDAMTAVSLVYPIQNLAHAAGVGFGVGINAMVARRLGEGKTRMANQTASQGVFLSALHGMI